MNKKYIVAGVSTIALTALIGWLETISYNNSFQSYTSPFPFIAVTFAAVIGVLTGTLLFQSSKLIVQSDWTVRILFALTALFIAGYSDLIMAVALQNHMITEYEDGFHEGTLEYICVMCMILAAIVAAIFGAGAWQSGRKTIKTTEE